MVKLGPIQQAVLRKLEEVECAFTKDLLDVHPERSRPAIGYALRGLATRGLVRTEYRGVSIMACITDKGRRIANELRATDRPEEEAPAT